VDDDENGTETVKAVPRLLVSYNVRGGQEKENAMIHQHLFGRRVTATLSGGQRKRYRYSGLLERTDAEHIGQSVIMMRERDAEEFISFLHSLRVSCMVWRVWCRK